MFFLFNIQTEFTSTLNTFVYWFSNIIGLLFFILYFHHFVYLFVGLFKTAKVKKTEFNLHRFGIIISARNEELVIEHLIESIRKNDYPQDLVDIIVVADNCTDSTAQICRDLGCIVFERNDLSKIGKGYALHFLFDKLHNMPEYENKYDAYIVLDADNILTKNYITEINKVYDSGYKMVTSYRNTKNWGDNWISDGYGYWFLREARFQNNPRMMLHSSCAISGTGFLVDREVVKEYDNWCFFTLTEDIEFSAEFALSKRKIGYAHNAMLFDEQPTTFKQAWRQRERWSKGFYQVFGLKAGRLLKGMWTNFACWDILTNIFPALLISSLMIIVYPICMIIGGATGDTTAVMSSLQGLFSMVGVIYGTIFMFGLFVLIAEWKKIKMPTWKKIWHLFTFPLFMFTYLPIAIGAIFKKVEWKPIYHNAPLSMKDLGLDDDHHEEVATKTDATAGKIELTAETKVEPQATIAEVNETKVATKTTANKSAQPVSKTAKLKATAPQDANDLPDAKVANRK